MYFVKFSNSASNAIFRKIAYDCRFSVSGKLAIMLVDDISPNP